jgi:hypothetical protein
MDATTYRLQTPVTPISQTKRKGGDGADGGGDPSLCISPDGPAVAALAALARWIGASGRPRETLSHMREKVSGSEGW